MARPMKNIEIESTVFVQEYGEYHFQASYLKPPNDSNALVVIKTSHGIIKQFLFPAYKVWNIAAHVKDIADGWMKIQKTVYSKLEVIC